MAESTMTCKGFDHEDLYVTVDPDDEMAVYMSIYSYRGQGTMCLNKDDALKLAHVILKGLKDEEENIT